MVMPANIYFWFINFMILFKKLAYFLRNNILLILIFVLMYYRASLFCLRQQVVYIYLIRTKKKSAPHNPSLRLDSCCFYEVVLEIYSICSFILINPSKPVTSQVYYFEYPVISKNQIRDITKSNSSGVYI